MAVVGAFRNNERAAWSSERHRAERYRGHAERLQGLAETEQHPGNRERLLDLAGQYRELAARFARHRRPE
jgi:hypothetical protein